MPTAPDSAVRPGHPATPRPISLGLQGGGAYGAFTWGVLDRLLDDDRFLFDGISGTSAGAINAVVMTDGMAHGGGRAGAQAALRRFWTGLSGASLFSPIQRTPLDYLLGRWTLESSPGYHMMQMMSVAMGPSQALPGMNPVRQLMASLIDFERVRACDALRIFVHATNVRTGKGKLFAQSDMDVQRLMAAICLPQVFAAVEVDGEAYWDGSYVGNPALAPLVTGADARDLVLVQINPIARLDVPTTITDINSRSNEIAFNIGMLREVAAISQLQQVIDETGSGKVHAAPVRMHLISGTGTIGAYSLSSKYNANWDFVSHLHELGVAAAEQWLAQNADHVGVRATLDPDPIFQPGQDLRT